MKKFRNNGAIGALLDEYEKAITEIKEVINNISAKKLTVIRDQKTKDQDCKSIQTILTHVIRAGYCYIIEIRKSKGEQIDFVERKIVNSVKEYQRELDKMFAYNEKLFDDYPDLVIEEIHNQKKILVTWGQTYDIEQLFEHAIVHILRHRRQIERFLITSR